MYYAVLATAAALACTIAATLFSCYKELMSQPAVLMRPPAPQRYCIWMPPIGKAIPERITYKKLNMIHQNLYSRPARKFRPGIGYPLTTS